MACNMNQSVVFDPQKSKWQGKMWAQGFVLSQQA